MNLQIILQKYLVASYAYYILDESIIDDYTYDSWAKELLKYWHKLKHRHKYLLTKADLKAGTGYAIQKYPTIIKGAAVEEIRRLKELKNENSKCQG